MKRVQAGELWLASAVVILAAVIAAVPGAPAQQKAEVQAVARPTRPAATYTPVSAPTVGVKLLEDIFNRVKAVPQLAMAKTRLMQSEADKLSQAGPTDYKLAIKPRDVQWPALNRPQSLGAQMHGADSVAYLNTPRSRNIWERDNTPEPGEQKASKRNEPGQAAQYYVAQNLPAPSPQAPATAVRGQVFRQRADTAGKDLRTKSGVWEKEQESRPVPPPLATAASNLFNAARQFGTIQEYGASGGYSAAAGQSGNKAKGASGLARSKLSTLAAAEEQPAKGEQKAQDADEQIVSFDDSAAGGADAPSAGMGGGGGAHLDGGQLLNEGRREATVALLPPNVVTGIPLVKLGLTQSQVMRTLSASGHMEQSQVGGWKVWSYASKGSKRPALQVFMRYGQVEALRIFDTGVTGADFGVQLGDGLALVKQKFGEPAFILPEPKPGTGQNYVYPISQVAFLMARPSPDSQPQVMSMLIFNVK